MGAEEAPKASVTCPACGAVVDTPYCGYCGRQLHNPSAPTPRAFVRDGAVEALGLDHRIAITARDSLLRPAQVIRAHIDGRGARYVHPLKYLLLLAGLYMLVLAWLQPFSFRAIIESPDSYNVSLSRLVFGSDNVDELQVIFASRGLSEDQANGRFEGRMNTVTPVATALSLIPLALVLGLLWRGRPWREHALFLLVAWSAIWSASLIISPLLKVNTTFSVIADYTATYLVLAYAFFGFYGRRPVAPALSRFLVFVAAEIAVSSVVSLLMSAAILATIFIP